MVETIKETVGPPVKFLLGHYLEGQGMVEAMGATLFVGEILAALACFYVWYLFLKRTT